MSASEPSQKRVFCTLFDHNYLYKGLAMHGSLQKAAPGSTLWVLAMSDEAHLILSRLALENVRLVSLGDFEDDELRRIRATRSFVEYCWTLTPSLPLYVLKQEPDSDLVSYIDADCFFFSSPEPIFQELGDKSVMIIEHRYAPELAHLEATNGKYNVGMLIFRRDAAGLKALNWWREQCNEWCYYRSEDGKLGDQGYLNDWTERFTGVHVLRHKGGNVAPWNVKNYRVSRQAGLPMVDGEPLIFYHFHALKIFTKRWFDPSMSYRFLKEELKYIYDPYFKALRTAMKEVRAVDASFRHGFSQKPLLKARIKRLFNRPSASGGRSCQ